MHRSRATFVITLACVAFGCGCSAAPPGRAEREQPAAGHRAAPDARVLLDAIALEVDQVNAAAKIRAALRGQVDDVGPTDRVTSGTALLDDGELEHLAGAGPQAPTIFSVRARILDATRVRLEIELAFEGSEPMETTVVITEGRPVVLQGEAAVAGRRQALVLRAAVIRSDADLYAEFVKRSAHRGASP